MITSAVGSGSKSMLLLALLLVLFAMGDANAQGESGEGDRQHTAGSLPATPGSDRAENRQTGEDGAPRVRPVRTRHRAQNLRTEGECQSDRKRQSGSQPPPGEKVQHDTKSRGEKSR